MIYLDNAATTRLKPEVLDAMMPYLTKEWGNPSALYSFGKESGTAIQKSREIIADAINCTPDEIIFTSSGSEANSFALNRMDTSMNLSTDIEHKSIMSYFKCNNEFPGIYVDNNGKIDLQYLERMLETYEYYRPLIATHYVNNEIGTIQDIDSIARIARKYNCGIHIDAVQAFGFFPLDMSELDIDTLSVSGHKIGAPKGIGFLYVNKKIKENFNPLIYGGKQEWGLRGGTENVAYIVGLAKAVELLKNKNVGQIAMLTDYLAKSITKEIHGSYIVGSPKAPHIVNICFPGVSAESVMVLLDLHGICVSSGSACSSGEPSHVLKAIGLSKEDQRSCIRFSLGEDNTVEEIKTCVAELKSIIDSIKGEMNV